MTSPPSGSTAAREDLRMTEPKITDTYVLPCGICNGNGCDRCVGGTVTIRPTLAMVRAMTLHLQTEWAGPYMARSRDYGPDGPGWTDDQKAALRAADHEADGEAMREASMAMLAFLRAGAP